ncbi:MAG: hypothetical protein J7M38_09350, partial [Armatimonadetes bacterium]|nr:hypothetical protein [Armatimonadota bacterium]
MKRSIFRKVINIFLMVSEAVEVVIMFRGGFGCEKVWILVVIWMLFASVFVLRVVPEASATRTWIVDNMGGGDFTTINGALSAASDGDTIYVRYGTGTYTENLVVSKKVNIIGQLIQNVIPPTISAANQNTHVIRITTYPVLIENFKITGALSGNAGVFSTVSAKEGSEVRLQNLEIYSNSYGIEILYIENGDESVIPSYHIIDSCNIHGNYGPGIRI